LAAALRGAGEAVQARMVALEEQLAGDRLAGEQMASELAGCATEEAEIQAARRGAGEHVTEAEVAAQRLRDQAGEAEVEVTAVAERLGFARPGTDEEGDGGGLAEEEGHAHTAPVGR